MRSTYKENNMKIDTQTFSPNEDNLQEILSLSSLFTGDDKHRYESSIESLANNIDGFKELHLLINDDDIVGFLALRGTLPCEATNHIMLETVYVLIHDSHRGQKLSGTLVSKYTESVTNWVVSALQTSHSGNYQELVFNLQISPISESGFAFRKNSVISAAGWCVMNLQPLLNNDKINTFGVPYMIFDWGLPGGKRALFPLAGEIKKFEQPSAKEMSDKPLFEIALGL